MSGRTASAPGRRRAATWPGPGGALLLGWLAVTARAGDGPLSVDEALRAIETEPGLRVEIVAAEPEVIDPVAMAFDERGVLFVVEGRGYPTREGHGVIAVLSDPDRDGQYAREGEFATGLRFPTGLLPWRGGLYVTDAPDLFYLEDRDGDGRAETRRVVLTGFATDRSTQLRVNDPTLGPDGWIWLAGGLSGGKVRAPGAPGLSPVDLSGMDLRFDPCSGAFETVDGKSQYGLSFDDFGRRFICMNRVQAQHVVIESSVLARNPRLAFSDTVENLPEERVEDLLRGQNAAARIFPISDNITTADSHAGTFSAACAVTVWRGGALPSRYDGHVLSCDPTGNLVHHDELVPRGATFVARRSRDHRELLASSDNWFRPVYLASGPDGALYVCDMYRKVIEHPDYLPEEIRRRTDFESGRDRGRIYRIAIGGARPGPKPPPRRTGDVVELVKALSSPEGWRRETARRLLIEGLGDDRERSGDILTALRAPGEDPAATAAARSAALRLLDRGGALRGEDLLGPLASPHAGVREAALDLARGRTDGNAQLAQAVLGRATDEAARVRFACARVLVDGPRDERTVSALVEIAVRGCEDRWTRAVVLAAAHGIEPELLARWIRVAASAGGRRGESGGALELTRELARAAAAWPGRALDVLRRELARPGAPSALLIGLVNGLSRGGLPRERMNSIGEPALAALADAARQAARTDDGGAGGRRVAAVEFLGVLTHPEDRGLLVAMIGSAAPPEVQVAAVRSLRRYAARTDTARELLARWSAAPVAVREAILGAFLSVEAFAPALLDAMDRGEVAPTALGAGARERLLAHGVEGVRLRARRLLEGAVAERDAVFARFRPAASMSGETRRGREIFRERCAPCHQLDREGVRLGPDLLGMRNQPKEVILLHVLVPNHEIAPGFNASVVVTRRGEVLTGLVVSETPTSLTLRMQGGEERAVLRGEILRRSVAAVSLMPDGLEEDLALQDVADLLAYLRGEG